MRALLAEPGVLADLNDLYDREVLPVFAGIGLGEEAQAYRRAVIERFMNPFLNHSLADIFTNHEAKKRRRFGGLIDLKTRQRHCARATPSGGRFGRRRMIPHHPKKQIPANRNVNVFTSTPNRLALIWRNP